MIEFGTTLRAAREAKGYTVRQLAEKTNILASVIEALEREDFSVIAAPIYGRGFVRLYCEAVGLEPKPLVAEFMDILNGNREPVIRERASIQPEEPAPLPAEEPAPLPAEGPAAPPAEEPSVSAAEEPTDTNEAPLEPPQYPQHDFFTAADPALTDEPARESEFSRYAAPIHADRESRLPTFPWRLGVLAAAAIALLVLLIFGIRALYRATSSTAIESPDEIPVETVAAPAAQDAAPRTPQKIPSLYID